MLGALARYEVHSHFVDGEKVEDPYKGAILERMAGGEGHWIGNHMMTHAVQLGDDPGPHEYEIGAAQRVIGDLASSARLFRHRERGGALDRRLFLPATVAYLQRQYLRVVELSLSRLGVPRRMGRLPPGELHRARVEPGRPL
ncbi:hypothetical protein ACGF3G_09705 [Streptomyces sp. NPDC048179]|uniref:hypothetical protein n=1 Tax=Streptomyces sp. NPDC048179 TaxID=3365506 RepID=UPI003721482E